MGLRRLGSPPRRPHEALESGHAFTAALREPGDRLRPHGGHTGPRGLATPPRQLYGTQETDHAPTAATQAQRTGHASTASLGSQGTINDSTTTIRKPGDRPRPHSSHTGPRKPATPPQWPYKAKKTNHAPMATTRGSDNGLRPHGGLMVPRGPDTPSQRPYGTRGRAMPPRHP